jgi:hypothetical protein
MTTNYEQTFQQQFNAAAAALAQGKKRDSVVQDLIMRVGLSPDQAEAVVTEAQRLKKKTFRQEGLRLFLTGVACLIIGIVVTGITYSLASNGGTYFVTTGLFVSGGVNMLRGLYRVAVG